MVDSSHFIEAFFVNDFIWFECFLALPVMRSGKRLLHWIVAGTAGGYNRGRILVALFENPRNANMLAKDLDLDYKTVQHHLRMLQKNRLVIEQGSGYGSLFFPSDLLEEYEEVFWEIWNKLKKKGGEK